MKIIVPMAGRGSRLRPHTLTVPKPLIPVGGKPIVHRLVEDIADVLKQKVTDVAFVTGDFGSEVEKDLLEVAKSIGAKGHIYQQKEPLGTAHAVNCAAEHLKGPVVIAFADTLFKANFAIDENDDGVLWVKQIEDPSAFGVIKLDNDGVITDFVEKPQKFVSDLAMIGIYYFKKGEDLKTEINYLIDNKIIKGGEYQLPDALRRLTEKGNVFRPGEVQEWMDCGNKTVTVETNKRKLIHDFEDGKELVDASVKKENSIIIPPSFIGKNVTLKNCVVGPYASIGDNSKLENSRVSNTIIQENAYISNVVISDSMIGNYSKIIDKAQNLSVGDYTHNDNS